MVGDKSERRRETHRQAAKDPTVMIKACSQGPAKGCTGEKVSQGPNQVEGFRI